jgi:putative toxin-antitoxin system antitoxin component (TIGR02293 family)
MRRFSKPPLNDFKHDRTLSAAAARVIAHAIRTFGSEEKAHDWLTCKCGALGHERPYELLRSGKSRDVNEELNRIDYGVYARTVSNCDGDHDG